MASLDLQVGADTDDIYRRLQASVWYWGNANVGAGASGSSWQYGSGMRFTNITIPKGSTILNGTHLRFRAHTNGATANVNTRISAEDVDDAVTFANDAGAFDTRWANRTTARVNWDGIENWTQNSDYNSAEIKTVIKEIVDRGGLELGTRHSYLLGGL